METKFGPRDAHAPRAARRRATTSTVEPDQGKDQSGGDLSLSGSGPEVAPASPVSPAEALQPAEAHEGGRRADPDPVHLRRRWLAVVLVAVIVAAGAGVGGGVVTAAIIRGRDTTTVSFSPNLSVFPRMNDVKAVLAKVLPSVVAIDAEGIDCTSATQGGTIDLDEGTGMILTAGGEILTNNHVIANATEIRVTLYGEKRPYAATLVGTDPGLDIALLQLHSPGHLRAVSLGESANTEVGEDVLAIGNALALSQSTPSVTEGIISAKGRSIKAGGQNCAGTESLSGLLQTQAAINSGNSGGPLVNAAGQVIGMNTAAAVTTPGDARTQNIGFAIPIANIRALLPGLRRGGTFGPPKAFLGVEVLSATRTNARAPAGGAVVVNVFPGSPAALAGIRVGDVIVRFGGQPITSALELTLAVRAARPGERVTVELYRGSELGETSLVLGTKPAPEPGSS